MNPFESRVLRFLGTHHTSDAHHQTPGPVQNALAQHLCEIDVNHFSQTLGTSGESDDL